MHLENAPGTAKGKKLLEESKQEVLPQAGLALLSPAHAQHFLCLENLYYTSSVAADE